MKTTVFMLLKGSGYSWMENVGSQNEVWCVAVGET